MPGGGVREETEDERILRLGREAAAVPATSMKGGDVCMEVTAEKQIVELENKLIQSELKLREAHKELARLYSKDDRVLKSSVGTQTLPPSQVQQQQQNPLPSALSPSRAKAHREGSRLLTNSDFKTFKRFVKRVYSRFNPKADPEEFIKKWAGRESEGVLYIQHNFGLSSAAMAEMCKDPRDVPAKRPPPRRTSPSPAGVKKDVGTSKTLEKPKKKALHEPSPQVKPPQKVKFTQNSTVVVTDPNTFEIHRGTYLGKDDRGLCCVQIFGSGSVSRYHAAALRHEGHSMTADKKNSKKKHDIFFLNGATPEPIVGDEVIAIPEGEEEPRNAVIAAKDARDGRCLVVFKLPEKSLSKTPPRGRRAPSEEPEPEEPQVQEMWLPEEDLKVVRYSMSSKGPSAVRPGGSFDF